MVALVLLGAVLRFHRLGEWSFWVDEVFQVRDSLAMDTVGEAVSAYYPLSYLLMRPALVGLGLSEWSARLIPAIIGIIAIPLMYIGAKMVLGRRVAILSVVLLAISPWHLYWSQNARFYTLLLILHNVSLLLFYLGLERDRFRLILFSFVFRVLALMTHPTAILLLPIYVLYFAALKILPFEKPSGLRYRYLIPMTIVPLLLYVAYDGYRIIFADQTSIFLAFVQTFIGYPNLTAFSILGSILYRVGMPLALLALFGGVIMLIKGVRLGLLLGLAAAIPIISVMALSSFTFTAFRYAFVALPGFILLGAYFTIQALRGRTGIWPILIFLGAMVLILSQDHVLEDAGHYLGAGWQFGALDCLHDICNHHWWPGNLAKNRRRRRISSRTRLGIQPVDCRIAHPGGLAAIAGQWPVLYLPIWVSGCVERGCFRPRPTARRFGLGPFYSSIAG